MRGAAYLTYADQARWALVQAAGVDLDELAASGVGPVNLETTVRFRNELRAGDEVAVESTFEYGSGRVSRVHQLLRRRDGEVAAEVSSVSGMLDLATRRLRPDPGACWLRHAREPGVLGLAPRPAPGAA